MTIKKRHIPSFLIALTSHVRTTGSSQLSNLWSKLGQNWATYGLYSPKMCYNTEIVQMVSSWAEKSLRILLLNDRLNSLHFVLAYKMLSWEPAWSHYLHALLIISNNSARGICTTQRSPSYKATPKTQKKVVTYTGLAIKGWLLVPDNQKWSWTSVFCQVLVHWTSHILLKNLTKPLFHSWCILK